MRYQEIVMPKPGKEQGIRGVIQVIRIDGEIERLEIPYRCNIEKVIILFGDVVKTRKFYESLKK